MFRRRAVTATNVHSWTSQSRNSFNSPETTANEILSALTELCMDRCDVSEELWVISELSIHCCHWSIASNKWWVRLNHSLRNSSHFCSTHHQPATHYHANTSHIDGLGSLLTDKQTKNMLCSICSNIQGEVTAQKICGATQSPFMCITWHNV